MLPADNEIVVALTKSDEAMFENVFRHYYNPLCSYVKGILNDRDEAEEVVQQTMVKIWEKRESMVITQSLKSYLYRAVHNTALNKIRQTKVRTLYAEDLAASGNDFSEQASHKVTKSELEHQIENAINKLPEQCRMVFKLSRYEEMKYSQIAEHLDISIKTVENHMGKALKLMREYLKDYLIWIILLMPGFI